MCDLLVKYFEPVAGIRSAFPSPQSTDNSFISSPSGSCTAIRTEMSSGLIPAAIVVVTVSFPTFSMNPSIIGGKFFGGEPLIKTPIFTSA